jgi:hypothetical protein
VAHPKAAAPTRPWPMATPVGTARHTPSLRPSNRPDPSRCTVGSCAAPTGGDPHETRTRATRGELRHPHRPRSPHNQNPRDPSGTTPPPQAAIPTQPEPARPVGNYAGPTGRDPHASKSPGAWGFTVALCLCPAPDEPAVPRARGPPSTA